MNIGSTSGSAMTVSTQATHMVSDAEQRVTVAAQQVAGSMSQRPIEETGGVTEALVDMQQGKQLVSAAGKLIEAQSAQIGYLLDTQVCF